MQKQDKKLRKFWHYMLALLGRERFKALALEDMSRLPSTHWLITVLNSSFRRSDASFQPPQAPGMQAVNFHTLRQNTDAHNIKTIYSAAQTHRASLTAVS